MHLYHRRRDSKNTHVNTTSHTHFLNAAYESERRHLGSQCLDTVHGHHGNSESATTDFPQLPSPWALLSCSANKQTQSWSSSDIKHHALAKVGNSFVINDYICWSCDVFIQAYISCINYISALKFTKTMSCVGYLHYVKCFQQYSNPKKCEFL